MAHLIERCVAFFLLTALAPLSFASTGCGTSLLHALALSSAGHLSLEDLGGAYRTLLSEFPNEVTGEVLEKMAAGGNPFALPKGVYLPSTVIADHLAEFHRIARA